MKRKLQEKYGDHLFISEVCGRKNVVCFKDMATRLMNEKWCEDRDGDVSRESERIVVTAAKLIKAGIREMANNTTCYPASLVLRDPEAAKQWVPRLLQTFMKILITVKLKQTQATTVLFNLHDRVPFWLQFRLVLVCMLIKHLVHPHAIICCRG